VYSVIIGEMKYLNFLVKNAVLDFKRNKIRTFLTSLGIMIGVFSVVLLISLGIGLKNYLAEQFESLGANLIIVFPGTGFGGEGGLGGGFSSLAGAIQFDERDYRALQRMRTADYVVPGYITTLNLEAEHESKVASVQGVNEEFFPIFDLKLIDGEFFSKGDVASAAKIGVIAEGLAVDLFGDADDAVGKVVRVKNLRIKVVGVVENIGDPEQDNSVMIPYTTTFGSLNTDKTFFSIYIGVKDDGAVTEAKEEAEGILLDRYDEDQFEVIEPSELLDTISQIFTIVNGVLVAIGSISLLVGGIGIMNIMYANVTERTKEIGIRRAIGAKKTDILTQFITESVLLSLFGGVLGLLLAIAIVVAVRPFFPLGINALSVGLAVGISSLIGIFFGAFPARRAANLTPIEAIRYE
jgi:putative ABC transport system permease protein